MASTTESFLDRFASELDAMEVVALEGVAEHVDRWLVGRPERRAPVHGDYRLDNLMFAPDGTVTALDWQTLSLGLPARDVAFLLSTGLSVDDRRTHEATIVEAYRHALEAHGVEGHGAEECFDDYAFSMLQGPLIAELGWLVAETTERGDAMFMAMVRRACAAIVDLDTFSRI
jgi:aminoglycoside phosphotransferase (APT) family kinase protein